VKRNHKVEVSNVASVLQFVNTAENDPPLRSIYKELRRHILFITQAK